MILGGSILHTGLPKRHWNYTELRRVFLATWWESAKEVGVKAGLRMFGIYSPASKQEQCFYPFIMEEVSFFLFYFFIWRLGFLHRDGFGFKVFSQIKISIHSKPDRLRWNLFMTKRDSWRHFWKQVTFVPLDGRISTCIKGKVLYLVACRWKVRCSKITNTHWWLAFYFFSAVTFLTSYTVTYIYKLIETFSIEACKTSSADSIRGAMLITTWINCLIYQFL